MEPKIPIIVEQLYSYFVMPPNPALWPDHLRDDPVRAHGLWSFYQGLCIALQLSGGCLETL